MNVIDSAGQGLEYIVYPKYVYRESYMRACVLLNLLNELEKTDKMRGLPSILSFFCNKFNQFNNTGAQMLFLFII